MIHAVAHNKEDNPTYIATMDFLFFIGYIIDSNLAGTPPLSLFSTSSRLRLDIGRFITKPFYIFYNMKTNGYPSRPNQNFWNTFKDRYNRLYNDATNLNYNNEQTLNRLAEIHKAVNHTFTMAKAASNLESLSRNELEKNRKMKQLENKLNNLTMQIKLISNSNNSIRASTSRRKHTPIRSPYA